MLVFVLHLVSLCFSVTNFGTDDFMFSSFGSYSSLYVAYFHYYSPVVFNIACAVWVGLSGWRRAGGEGFEGSVFEVAWVMPCGVHIFASRSL